METNKNFSLEVARDFQVPAEQVYKAWTEFEALKNWWKPLNSELTDLQNDLKAQGKLKYTFTRRDNNEQFVIEGEYFEVIPNEKLVYSWKWQLPEETSAENNYRLNIEFSNQEGGSNFKVRQEGFRDEEAASTHREGWENALDALASYLSSGGQSAGQQDAEIAGYNEAPEQQKVGE